MIAEYFYKTTVNDTNKKTSKELHKMKASVINNTLLSLIVIENDFYEHILWGDQAIKIKNNLEEYVNIAQKLLTENGSTKSSKEALDFA